MTIDKQQVFAALNKLRETSTMSIDDTCKYGNIVLEALIHEFRDVEGRPDPNQTDLFNNQNEETKNG